MGVLSWIWSLVAASAPEEQPNESAMPKPPETSLPSADPGTWQTDADKLYGPRSEDFARRRQAVAVLRSLGRWYYEQHQNMRMAICCYMRALCVNGHRSCHAKAVPATPAHHAAPAT